VPLRVGSQGLAPAEGRVLGDTDSPWPYSQEYIEGTAFQRITPEQTQKIVAENAAGLYQIELN
jgi:hypothetical protein